MTEHFIIRMLGPTVNLKLKWRDRQPNLQSHLVW